MSRQNSGYNGNYGANKNNQQISVQYGQSYNGNASTFHAQVMVQLLGSILNEQQFLALVLNPIVATYGDLIKNVSAVASGAILANHNGGSKRSKRNKRKQNQI